MKWSWKCDVVPNVASALPIARASVGGVGSVVGLWAEGCVPGLDEAGDGGLAGVLAPHEDEVHHGAGADLPGAGAAALETTRFGPAAF